MTPTLPFIIFRGRPGRFGVTFRAHPRWMRRAGDQRRVWALSIARMKAEVRRDADPVLPKGLDERLMALLSRHRALRSV